MVLPNVDREVLTGWIGLRTRDGLTITELKAVGHKYVVFVAEKDGHEFVLKLPRGHVGFVIDVPPPEIFQVRGPRELGGGAIKIGDDDDLVLRLSALTTSSHLSYIWPLDTVWQRLAVDLIVASRISGKDRKPITKGPLSQRLVTSPFVDERLDEWAAIRPEPRDKVVTIYAHDAVVYADFAEILSRDAEAAARVRKNFSRKSRRRKQIEPPGANPFLPFLAALASGYAMSDRSAFSVAEKLAEQEHIDEILTELGQILHVLQTYLDKRDRQKAVAFIFEVARLAPNVGIDDLILCMQEL